MKVLSRDDLLALRPKVEKVEIEGLGVVYVRGLTARERGEVESTIMELDPETGQVHVRREGLRRLNVLLAAFGLVDEKGENLFDPRNPKDLQALEQVDAQVIAQIADAVRSLSGMGEEQGKGKSDSGGTGAG